MFKYIKKNYNPQQKQKKKIYVYFQYHLYLKYIFIQSKFFLFFHEKLRSEFKTFPTAQSLFFFLAFQYYAQLSGKKKTTHEMFNRLISVHIPRCFFVIFFLKNVPQEY